MEIRHTYHMLAQWHRHDRAFVQLDHGAPRIIHFSAPPEFGGEPGFWTPEHFLLAAVTSCYIASFKAVAQASRLEFQGLEVSAEGVLEKEGGTLRFTQIHLKPILIIHEEEQRERGLHLLEKAERICLVTRSMSATTVLEPKIMVEKPVSI